MRTRQTTRSWKGFVIWVAVWATVTVVLFVATATPSTLNAFQDEFKRTVDTATQWQVFEQGWIGTWTRRGNSNTFDARWTMPGQNDIQGVIEMKISGRDVRMDRTDLYTNQRCEYRGEISKDGRTAQGWLSCHNGPRVNWNANLVGGNNYFPGNMEVVSPPPISPPGRSEGPIVPKYTDNYSLSRFNLTGVWKCSDGGTYYVRQLGNNVWWYGESSNGQWSNIFHGALDGDWLEGFWLDVPKGRDHDNGALRIRIDSRNEFHREHKTGDDFGGSHWRRIR